ncbi:MAG: DUF373 family protein [Thermoprotei archaeon]|nr:DUF373 family protein [Thermoprotei archaeon]
MSSRPKRILVLYIDRDDDLGVKAGIRSPIVGREENFKAASSFALRAPEDADVNAMFAAIQTYDNLKAQGFAECEVATITGSPNGGLEADLKISTELDMVLKRFPAESIIMVSDGVDDEQVLPIIQSKVPVISVRRVVVQQSKSVEETYMLLLRYLKKVMEVPHYRRLFLGFPGILTLSLASLALLNLLQYASLLIIMLIGLIMCVKGFSLDERAADYYRRFTHWWSAAPILFFAYFVATITFVVGLYMGATSCYDSLDKGLAYVISMLILAPSPEALLHSIDAFIASALIILVGNTLNSWLADEELVWRNVVGAVFVSLSRQIFIELGMILRRSGSLLILLYWTILTLVVSASLTIIFMVREKFRRKTSKDQKPG